MNSTSTTLHVYRTALQATLRTDLNTNMLDEFETVLREVLRAEALLDQEHYARELQQERQTVRSLQSTIESKDVLIEDLKAELYATTRANTLLQKMVDPFRWVECDTVNTEYGGDGSLVIKDKHKWAIPTSTLQVIEASLKNARRILAIKSLREVTKLGLRDAKYTIETCEPFKSWLEAGQVTEQPTTGEQA